MKWSATDNVAWTAALAGQGVSTPIVVQAVRKHQRRNVVITAADAKTGERVWQHRVPGVFSASPIAAAGRVYFVSESGRTIVMRATRTAEVRAENDLSAHLMASPAAARGRLRS